MAVTAATLVAAEFFLRWHYRDVLSSPSGADYFYNRSYHKFAKERGTLGIRGKRFDLIGHHALRIVVMGDSFTYGQGVYPYTLRFPEQAEILFRKKYPDADAEFINVGFCGADLPQYNKSILNFVTRLHPDFVLYQWFVNDMNVSHSFVHTPPLISNKPVHQLLTKHSVLYFLLQRGWNHLQAKIGMQQTYYEHFAEQFADPAGESSLAARNMLNQLMDQLDSSKIAHGIVLFPDFNSRQREYQLGLLHELVLKACKERHVDCLDLRAAYSNYDDHVQMLWANVFDHHPSALAHRVAAEKIMEFFGETWKQMALRGRSADK